MTDAWNHGVSFGVQRLVVERKLRLFARSVGVAQWLFMLSLSASMVACTPLSGVQEIPVLAAADWQGRELKTDQFSLLIYQQAMLSAPQVLNVYLHGDGRAFLRPTLVSMNPTPRQSVAAELASRDPGHAVFLARPCYYVSTDGTSCDASLWTYRRYGPVVVDAVVEALRTLARHYPGVRFRLVGYSGGGVIAMLVAREVEAVITVVTIAAPLDTDAWTSLHGYSSLEPGSNPAEISNWPQRLRQVHLVGGADSNVPSRILASFVSRSGAKVETREFPDYDHTCCWQAGWSAIVEGLFSMTSLPSRAKAAPG